MERFAKTERAYSAPRPDAILPSTVNYEAAGSLADAAAQRFSGAFRQHR